MSCRETGAGSAFTSWVRFSTGRALSEPATLSTFHRLRNVHLSRDASAQRNHTDQQYRELLARQRSRVQVDPSLTERERESLLARLDLADVQPMPDQATVYALFNVESAVRNRISSQSGFASMIAARTSSTPAQVSARYQALASGLTRRTATDVTREATERAASLGLPRDAGSVHAMLQLESEARHTEAIVARRSPQRVARTRLTAPSATSSPDVSIREWGWDPQSGRLEVALETLGTPEPVVFAYRGVDSAVIDNFHAHPGQAWDERVRGNPDYQYSDEDTAALDGVASRCPDCGEFANTSHTCTPPVAPTRMTPYDRGTRWTRQVVPTYTVNENGQPSTVETNVSLPGIRNLQRAVIAGPVEVAFSRGISVWVPETDENGAQFQRGYGRTYRVEGSFTVTRDGARGPVTVDASEALCRCPDYQVNGHCPHVDLVTQAITDRIERPNTAAYAAREQTGWQEATEFAATRIERMREEAIATDWTRNPGTAADAAATWRRESDVLYSENPAAFAADVSAALDRAAAKAGVPDVPYVRENALDGLCQPGSGKAFGVEIEYDFPPSMSYQQKEAAQAAIGRALYDAGLTYSAAQQPYRASQSRGFRDTHTDRNGVGNWSWERDGSVAGELVTPGMYDTEETWQKMETALQILRDNGATASTKAGAHVHVGTADYHGSAAAYSELARLVTQHEDVLVRLSSSPERGTHRNNGFSRPLPPVPVTGFRDIRETRDWQSNGPNRYATVNFQNCSGGASDHPEFRVFDATLDPGTVQAQVMLAVACTAAAERHAAAGGTTRGKEPWGSHVRRTGLLTPDSVSDPTDVASMIADSGTVRSFLDTLFRRREDKARLASVFAYTQWTAPSVNPY